MSAYRALVRAEPFVAVTLIAQSFQSLRVLPDLVPLQAHNFG